MILSIPLILAQFCANCEDVSIMGAGSRCPVCQSTALIPLAKILNRPQTVIEIVDIVLGENDAPKLDS